MSKDTRDLIKAESRRDTFGFVVDVVQRGRLRPKKYKHQVIMPDYLYEELRNRGVIDSEALFIDEIAFFEYRNSEVLISFISLFSAEDLHRKIDHFLVTKFAGSYPIRRAGLFF